MTLVVVNVGSSSLKLALVERHGAGARIITQSSVEIGSADAVEPETLAALRKLSIEPERILGVGHRIVHGGRRLREPTVLSPEVEAELERISRWAPLHVPPALAGLRAARAWAPHVPHIAVFDTAFHSDRAEVSLRYPLPAALCAARDLYRYGFHGIAHAGLRDAVAEHEQCAAAQVDAVTLQLGSGCSVCAISAGRSIETSMGFSPLGGVPMSTRPGDLDPGVLVELLRDRSPRELEDLLTRESGLLGMAGSADMRELLRRESAGDAAAKLALEMFVRRLVMCAGAHFTLLEGRGALVFGGGIGANSAQIRARIARGLAAWNVALDSERNASNERGRISGTDSRPVYVFDTDEATGIASAAYAALDVCGEAASSESCGTERIQDARTSSKGEHR